MKRIQPISALPEYAAVVTTDVKITFVVNMLEAARPLFINKNPQNPLPPSSTPDDSNNDA